MSLMTSSSWRRYFPGLTRQRKLLPYGHPSDEVMARLEEKLGSENIYRTDEQGTIEFITDGERLWVRVD